MSIYNNDEPKPRPVYNNPCFACGRQLAKSDQKHRVPNVDGLLCDECLKWHEEQTVTTKRKVSKRGR